MGPFCVKFAPLPHARMDLLWVIRFPPTEKKEERKKSMCIEYLVNLNCGKLGECELLFCLVCFLDGIVRVYPSSRTVNTGRDVTIVNNLDCLNGSVHRTIRSELQKLKRSHFANHVHGPDYVCQHMCVDEHLYVMTSLLFKIEWIYEVNRYR